MKLVYKGPGPTRLYDCGYYQVEAPPTSCFFCRHLTDIWWDHTNGPYMFYCDLVETNPDADPDRLDRGMAGACGDFEEEQQNDPI